MVSSDEVILPGQALTPS